MAKNMNTAHAAQDGVDDAVDPASYDLPRVLTVAELAGLLRIHTNQVYSLLQRGEIPGARRVGGVYRISRDRVLQWLADGTGQVEPTASSTKRSRGRRRA